MVDVPNYLKSFMCLVLVQFISSFPLFIVLLFVATDKEMSDWMKMATILSIMSHITVIGITSMCMFPRFLCEGREYARITENPIQC